MLDLLGKRSFLEKKDDEVKEFHPLLGQLFQRLPHIARTEYTHGRDEKGADFLLQRLDPTISETTWTAVVIKVGKIHLNITEIIRQVDDCSMPRLVEGGMTSIVPRDIWIVTNSTITQNAKDKIHNKFPAKSISFLSQDQLVELIDRHADFLWHQIPIKIGTYLQSVSEEIKALDAASNLLQGKAAAAYVEIDLRPKDDDSYALTGRRKNKAKTTSLAHVIQAQRVALVEGEMGSGKSKLLRESALQACTANEVLKTNRIPIYTTFKRLVDQFGGDLSKLVDSMESQLQIGSSLPQGYEFIAFIDGVDEISNNDAEILEKLSSTLERDASSKRGRAVFATRPFATPEKSLQLGKLIPTYEIRGLSIKKLRKFIEQSIDAANIPKSLMRDLQGSELFRQIPHNPISAILLANLISENAEDIPTNLTELYQRSIQLMLGKWDATRGIFFTQKEHEAALRACGQVAKLLIENSLSDITKSDAIGIFKAFIDQRNIGVPAEQLFEKVLLRCAVLGESFDKCRVFFRHRSFGEYLYAHEALHSEEMLKIDSRIYRSQWKNIYFFHFGLRKDCPELLERVMTLPASTEGERWAKVFNSGQFLMAGFTSPYIVVEKHLDQLFVVAAQLFLDIRSGNTKTNLTQYSEMFCLWFIQYLMRQTYGYEYFRNGLQTTLIKIDASTLPDDLKATALFLLGAVLSELNDFSAMEYLVDDFGTSRIPLGINLALDCESRLQIQLGRTSFMKKHHRRLTSILRTEHGNSQKTISALFERPIANRPKRPAQV